MKRVMLSDNLVMIFLFVAATLVGSCSTQPKQEAPAVEAAVAKVQLEVYGTGLCAQTASSVRAAVTAARLLGPEIGLKVTLVGLAVGKGERRSFASQAGPAEVEADKVIVCGKAASGPQVTKKLDLLECLFSAQGGPLSGLDACAAKLSLDAAAIRQCAASQEGEKLLAAEFDEAKLAKIIATPMVTMNGRPYVGVRTALELERAACAQLSEADRPKACAGLPEPKKLTVYAITDKRCSSCDVESPLHQLMNTVPGVEPKRLDWKEDEAKAVLAKSAVQRLPALLFGAELSEHPEVTSQLALWIERSGEMFSVLIPEATFDPAAEICDNGIDDTGNGQVDCGDSSCVENVACRKEVRERLDVFTLGGCNVAAGAMATLDGLYEEMNGLRLGIHFIAFRREGKVVGMRGPNELAEAKLELCAMKQAASDKKGFEFAFCRAEANYAAGFEKCAEESGLDQAQLEKCGLGPEGDAALSADMELAEKLGIRRSPSFLINNRYLVSGSQEDLRKVYCDHNPQVEKCRQAAPSHQGHNH